MVTTITVVVCFVLTCLLVHYKEKKFMATFDEFVQAVNDKFDKLEILNTEIDKRVEGITGDVLTLKDEVQALKNSLGKLSPEQETKMAAVLDRAATLTDKQSTLTEALKALDDMTAPEAPTPE